MNRYIDFAATSVKKEESIRKRFNGAKGKAKIAPQTIFIKIWLHHAVVTRADNKILPAIDRPLPTYSD